VWGGGGGGGGGGWHLANCTLSVRQPVKSGRHLCYPSCPVFLRMAIGILMGEGGGGPRNLAACTLSQKHFLATKNLVLLH